MAERLAVRGLIIGNLFAQGSYCSVSTSSHHPLLTPKHTSSAVR